MFSVAPSFNWLGTFRQEAPTVDRPVPATPLASRRTVLLVEHRQEVCERLSAALQSQDVTLAFAATSASARDWLRRWRCSLVLASVGLPDESGWLMASKMVRSRTKQRVWLYTASESCADRQWLALTRVEQLIYHDGDTERLANEVHRRLRGCVANRTIGWGKFFSIDPPDLGR